MRRDDFMDRAVSFQSEGALATPTSFNSPLVRRDVRPATLQSGEFVVRKESRQATLQSGDFVIRKDTRQSTHQAAELSKMDTTHEHFHKFESASVPQKKTAVTVTKTPHEQHMDLLAFIADSLQPLREIAVAQRETAELQREVAQSLRRLEGLSLDREGSYSDFLRVPTEEISRPKAHVLDASRHANSKEAVVMNTEPSTEAYALVASATTASAQLHSPLLRKPAATPVETSTATLANGNLQQENELSEEENHRRERDLVTINTDASLCLISQATSFFQRDVYCRFNIFNIEEINLKKQAIKADFYFEAAWEMPELLSDADGSQRLLAEDQIEWSQVWQPNIIFTNKLGDLNIHAWNAIDASYAGKFGKPMASWRAKVSGEFTQQLDMHQFPYDVQHVYIGISSDHIASVCALKPNSIIKSSAQLSFFSIRDQFEVKFDADHSVQDAKPRKGAGGEYSQLRISVDAQRNPTFFLVNVILLMFLTVLVYFMAMMPISPFQVAERMEIGTNIVLTGVALKLLSAERLPDLPYLTYLDKYLLGSIGLIVAMIGELFVCYKVVPADAAELFDQISLSTIGGLWVVGHVPIFQPLWSQSLNQFFLLFRRASNIGEIRRD